jgi:hypothetical protein
VARLVVVHAGSRAISERTAGSCAALSWLPAGSAIPDASTRATIAMAIRPTRARPAPSSAGGAGRWDTDWTIRDSARRTRDTVDCLVVMSSPAPDEMCTPRRPAPTLPRHGPRPPPSHRPPRRLRRRAAGGHTGQRGGAGGDGRAPSARPASASPRSLTTPSVRPPSARGTGRQRRREHASDHRADRVDAGERLLRARRDPLDDPGELPGSVERDPDDETVAPALAHVAPGDVVQEGACKFRVREREKFVAAGTRAAHPPPLGQLRLHLGGAWARRGPLGRRTTRARGGRSLGEGIAAQTVQQMVDRLMTLPAAAGSSCSRR